MFTTIIVRPIFNLLVLIYGILPGHDLGLSIILFTVVIRMLMWPLVKKQLKQARAMRELQPEIKRIKQATKGNKQKEQQLVMELYKEREVSPFGSIGTLVIQLFILFGLYSGLRKVVYDPKEIVTFAYPSLQHLAWIKHLKGNISAFHDTLFNWVNLNKGALSKSGVLYLPALIIVLGSALTQFFQSKQLLPQTKESRKLRDILKDAGSGQKADSSEVNAAVSRNTIYFLPVITVVLFIGYPSAMSLYWLTGGLVAFLQQAYILREDTQAIEAVVDKGSSSLTSKNLDSIAEAEVVESTVKPNKNKKTKKPKHKRRKR